MKFKELTYDLAEVMYEYPFRLPANFTYVMRALMTLEGIGIVTDPGFSFFETAKPYAKEFMLRREGKAFRKLMFDKLTGRENGNGAIEWSRVWKLTKMAAQMYLDRKSVDKLTLQAGVQSTSFSLRLSEEASESMRGLIAKTQPEGCTRCTCRHRAVKRHERLHSCLLLSLMVQRS